MARQNTSPPARRAHHLGHRQRLRSRLTDAPEKLQDYEILELLLGYVILRRDTKPIAKELLVRFGSLRGVMDARPEQYLDIPGLGDGVAGLIALLREFTSRYLESPVRKRETLCTPETVGAMARERLGRLAHEEIWVAYVDNGQRLITWERAVRGTYGTAPLNARDIVERGLLLKATGFILVHNHPGGNAQPSGADSNLTTQLQLSARIMGLRFHDHVIVTDAACYSMMSEGLI